MSNILNCFHKKHKCLFVSIATVIVVYVLSFGPILSLAVKHSTSWPLADKVIPLIFKPHLLVSCHSIHYFRYIRWWGFSQYDYPPSFENWRDLWTEFYGSCETEARKAEGASKRGSGSGSENGVCNTTQESEPDAVNGTEGEKTRD